MEASLAHMSPEERNEAIRATPGMTWAQAMPRALVHLLALAAALPAWGDSSGPRPRRETDLLRLIDPEKDTVEGAWKLEEGALVCAQKRPWARLQIPYIPPDEYDLTIVAERREGLEAINIGLVRGDAQFHAVVDGWSATMSGLSMIDKRWANANETTARGRLLENGRPATILCSIRKDGVSMTVDGRKVFDWKGDYARLGNISPLTVPDRRALYINSFNCVYRFSRMTVTPVSGQGRPLR